MSRGVAVKHPSAKLFLTFALLISASAFANTGFLSNGTCFETAYQATDDMYSRLSQPAYSYIDSSGAITRSLYYRYVSGVWTSYSAYAGVLSTSPAPYPSPNLSSCLAPSESFNNGLAYGAAFVSVMLIAFGFVACSRALVV